MNSFNSIREDNKKIGKLEMEYFTRLSNLFCSKKVNLSNVIRLVVLKVITKVRLSDIEQNKQIFSKRVLCLPLYDPYAPVTE